MIVSFRHKGLRQLYETGSAKGVPPQLVMRVRMVLSALDVAISVDELRTVPRWRLHRLSGKLKDFWSISVSGNWRIIFRFENGKVLDVDLLDYH
jgi:proteic killer suppression protein